MGPRDDDRKGEAEERDLCGRAHGDSHRQVHLVAHRKHDRGRVLRRIPHNRQQDCARWGARTACHRPGRAALRGARTIRRGALPCVLPRVRRRSVWLRGARPCTAPTLWLAPRVATWHVTARRMATRLRVAAWREATRHLAALCAVAAWLRGCVAARAAPLTGRHERNWDAKPLGGTLDRADDELGEEGDERGEQAEANHRAALPPTELARRRRRARPYGRLAAAAVVVAAFEDVCVRDELEVDEGGVDGEHADGREAREVEAVGRRQRVRCVRRVGHMQHRGQQQRHRTEHEQRRVRGGAVARVGLRLVGEAAEEEGAA
eukprot:4774688-Prymnesium_polylepis.1